MFLYSWAFGIVFAGPWLKDVRMENKPSKLQVKNKGAQNMPLQNKTFGILTILR